MQFQQFDYGIAIEYVIEGNLFLRWVSNVLVIFVDLAKNVLKPERVPKKTLNSRFCKTKFSLCA
jgi:hypothetical protein